MGRIMSNFDILVGLSQEGVSNLVAQYHASPPENDNPFKGRMELEILGQPAVIEWGVISSPEIILARPDCDVWLAAQGWDGLTNEEANRHCPKLPMLQLKFPQLDLLWGLLGADLSSGTSKDVIAHAILNLKGSTVGVELVAVTVDQSEFGEIDKQIFNLLVLPTIFKKAEEILTVIHLPELNLDELSFNPLQISQVDRCLVGASTLKSNFSPLDITGLTVPSDSVFILLSDNLVNAALSIAFTANGPFIKEDSGQHHGLANLKYKAEGLPSARLGSVEPLTIHAEANMNLEASMSLTAAGIALLVVSPLGCVISLFV